MQHQVGPRVARAHGLVSSGYGQPFTFSPMHSTNLTFYVCGSEQNKECNVSFNQASLALPHQCSGLVARYLFVLEVQRSTRVEAGSCGPWHTNSQRPSVSVFGAMEDLQTATELAVQRLLGQCSDSVI